MTPLFYRVSECIQHNALRDFKPPFNPSVDWSPTYGAWKYVEVGFFPFTQRISLGANNIISYTRFDLEADFDGK